MKTTIKTLTLILAVTLVSCNPFKNEPQQDFMTSTALSIFVKDGKVGVSSLLNKNNYISTEYWIDSTKTTYDELKDLLPAGNYFRTSIDQNYRASTVYKKPNGDLVVYKFPRNYSIYGNNQLVYYKGNEEFKMDTTALGAIHSVSANDTEIFAGFFGRPEYWESGTYLAPKVAFCWYGEKNIQILRMPTDYFHFQGVNAIYSSGKDVYVAGKMDFPMYWKNNTPVRLHENYGEVNQITTMGGNVYAVGYYNKRNSNSYGHTACYWIDDQLVELEDNAIAYSIFVLGKSVWVAGAVGTNNSNYKACYWKDGKRVMLTEKSR